MSAVRRAVPTLTGRQGNRARPLFPPTILMDCTSLLTLKLPVPPSLNRYYRNFRGRMVLAAEGRAYKDLIGLLRPKVFTVRPRDTITLEVFWHRHEARGDVDNVLKGVLDALQGVGYQNDAQIEILSIQRTEDPMEPPHCIVQIMRA